MKSTYPLVVIGAGPAGMAAACSAAAQGVEVAVFDEQANPGGQIYRNIDSSPIADINLLGKDYRFGLDQVQAFRNDRFEYFANAAVWYLDKAGSLGVLSNGINHRVKAGRIIIATGAQERPMPFPGWDKPGVMTAGAGQILLKSAAMIPAELPVLVGSGPLLLLLASQFLRAGVGIRAMVETTKPANRRLALRHVPRALMASDYLYKGLKMMMSIRRARVPWYTRATNLRAHGTSRLERICFDINGKTRYIDTGLVLVHQGIVPTLHMVDSIGCEINWNEAQQCWHPRTDPWGESSRVGIFVVGDGAAIGGARAATLSGQLAGLQVAQQLGLIDSVRRDQQARPLLNKRQRHLAIRPLLDAYYRLAQDALSPTDETLVCRCEDIDAAQIRSVLGLGCVGPNQAKAFLRCGMGPCQGRFCAATVEHIFADEQGRKVGEIGRFNARPPLKPVTLGQLAVRPGE